MTPFLLLCKIVIKFFTIQIFTR